jgi:hypothetical protein
MNNCVWFYRPGILNSHWAHPSCAKSGEFNYLSRITSKEQAPGCADYYNNKACPECGKPIVMDYRLIKED